MTSHQQGLAACFVLMALHVWQAILAHKRRK